jgi:LmbE family N-acetylglucosaminyl deacetylase
MQYVDYHAIKQTYDLVCVSPHLDDAVLSCAGQLINARRRGLRTLVVTVCTAVPAASASYSDLAVEFHGEWGLSESEAVTTRLREDQRAMQILGADFVWLDLDDAIYRMPDHYHSRETLFAPPHRDDQLAAQLAPMLSHLLNVTQAPRWLVPAGVGMHVDHLAVGDAVQQSIPVACRALYEEIPYALDAGEVQTRRAQLPPHTVISEDIGTVLAAKIAAIGCYASQMDALFKQGGHTMPPLVTAYHQQVGGGHPAECWYHITA